MYMPHASDSLWRESYLLQGALLHCLSSINGELRKHETRAQKLSFLITNFNTQLAAQQRLRQTPHKHQKLIQKRNGIKDRDNFNLPSDIRYVTLCDYV